MHHIPDINLYMGNNIFLCFAINIKVRNANIPLEFHLALLMCGNVLNFTKGKLPFFSKNLKD